MERKRRQIELNLSWREMGIITREERWKWMKRKI